MVQRWKWFLIRISKRPWFRASLFSVLGIATALVALAVAPYIPDDDPTRIGSDAVDNILNVLASSMLAVTTFSLSIMVAAYGSATSNVTRGPSRCWWKTPPRKIPCRRSSARSSSAWSASSR